MSTYWKKEYKLVIAIFFSGIIFNVGMPFLSVLQGKVIDGVVQGNSMPEIGKKLLLFLTAVLAIQFFRFMKRFYVRTFANRTLETMRTEIYHHMLYKSITKLSEEDAGDLMSKAVADVDICVEGMRKFTTELFDTGVLMVAYVIFLAKYDWKITLCACLFIPVAMYIAERGKIKIVAYSKQYRQQAGKVSGLTLARIDQISLLRIHGMEERELHFYEEELETLEKAAVKANLLENSMQPVYQVISMIGVVFVLYLGGEKVGNGIWTIGMFSAYLSMFAALALKASKASKLFNSIQKASVSWMRIKPYFQEPNEKAGERKESAKKTESGEMLVVNNLSFSYLPQEKKQLEHLSFSVKKGEIVGVTGPVACGKSTLGVAIEGLYPYEGSILVKGKELREYDAGERSKLISYMGHAPCLLSDTIYENITLGETGDISQVLRDVCLEEDIQKMQDGIHTRVGNGGISLSGGQQLRIALARTLYRKTPLILLDEPFFALDRETEKKIMYHLREQYKESAMVLISHRLRYFTIVDNILMMHKDKTTLFTNHDKLLQDAEYAAIYQLQMGE